ncbi:MAG: hypothetical protein ACRDZ8_10370 [Acidimicrobiales bacterium]
MAKRVSIPAVLVLVVVMVAAGCGGGSGKAATTTTVAVPSTTATTVPATTSTTAVNTAALTAKATAALWQQADWPTAYKMQSDGMGTCPNTSAACDSLNLETIWQEVTSCVGVTDTPEAKAVSPTYLEGIATQARVTVEYTTPAAASAIAAALTGPKFDGCMTTAFTADAKGVAESGGFTPSASTVSALTPPSEPSLPAGTSVSSSRINVTMTLGSGTAALQVHIYQDFLVYFNGGTIVRFFFLNPGGPFVVSVEQPLIMKVVTAAAS